MVWKTHGAADNEFPIWHKDGAQLTDAPDLVLEDNAVAQELGDAVGL